jgi:hypothetical protein
VRRLLPALLLLAACSGDPALTTTTAAMPTTTAPATTTTSATPTPSPLVLASLTVGDGIEYQSGGEDLPNVGPSLITADPSGNIHIYDPVANRILTFAGDETSVIDLAERDILGVTAIGAASDHLLVVEIFFGPLRQKVHRIEFDGTVRESLDLPAGFSLEDGLSGVLAGTNDEIVIEYGGGAYYGVWLDESDSFQTSQVLSVNGTFITSLPPDIEIAGTTIQADLAGDLGGLRYLGTSADGTHAIVREEVRITAAVFDVLTTVEWYSPTGGFIGSARVPGLDEQDIGAPPGIALLPDGRIVALVARPDAVQIVELPPLNVRITDLSQSA